MAKRHGLFGPTRVHNTAPHGPLNLWYGIYAIYMRFIYGGVPGIVKLRKSGPDLPSFLRLRNFLSA